MPLIMQVWDRQNAMHAIRELCYYHHSPELVPARSMLIERLCIYRRCYYRGSTVGQVNSDIYSTSKSHKKVFCIGICLSQQCEKC